MSQSKTFQFYLIQHQPHGGGPLRTIPLLFNDEKTAVEVSHLCMLEGQWTVRCLTMVIEGDLEGRTDAEIHEEARLDICIQLAQGPDLVGADGSTIDLSDPSLLKSNTVQ